MSRLPSTLELQQSTTNASPARTLRPRVKLSVHCLEPLLIDMGINLRRRDVRVSEHFLNNAQIGAVAQQMCGEAMSEQMWINVFLQTRVSRFFLHDLPDPRSR